jgi:hypothetical protein
MCIEGEAHELKGMKAIAKLVSVLGLAMALLVFEEIGAGASFLLIV